MKKIISILFLLFFLHQSFGQKCDVESGLKELLTLDEKGKFNEALTSIELLLNCNILSNSDKIKLGIWEYKMYRNILKPKKAYAALLRSESILKENKIPISLDFKLLQIEIYAIRNDQVNFQKINSEIESSIFNSSENNFNLGRFYLSLSYSIKNQGLTNKELAYFQKAMEAFNQVNTVSTYYLGSTLRGLGNMNRTLGDYDRSLSFYSDELILYQSKYSPDHFNIAVCHYNIGSVYYEKLEYELALDHYLKTLKIWKLVYATSNKKYLHILNEAIGDLYWELGDQENALNYFNEAISGERIINNDKSEETIFQGDSLAQKGDYNNAINYYIEAYNWRKKTYGENHILTGACKNFVARAIRSSGEIEKSLSAYQEAIIILVEEMTDLSWYINPTLDMKIQSHQYLLESLIAKGELFKERYILTKQLKDLEASLDSFETAILVLEDMKNQEMSESSRVFWSKRTLSLVESSIETSINLFQNTKNKSYLEKAFNFSERSKALLLLASLNDVDIKSFANVSEEIILKEKELKSSINEYTGRIESEEKRCTEVRTKMLTLWKNELGTQQNKYDILMGSIKKDYPQYYQLKYELPIANLQSLQKQLLNEDTALVSYFAGDDKTYVFLITNNDISIRSIEDSQILFEQTTSLFNTVHSQEQLLKEPQESFEEFSTLSFQLYKKLLGPELSNIYVKKLIIIPDGKLSYLPFDILLTKEKATSKRDYKSLNFLIKKYALSYSPSASIRILGQQKNSKTELYFGFAPNYEELDYSNSHQSLTNLSYNEQEVINANSLFEGSYWNGKNAKEDHLKENTSQVGILHLAMHGEVEDKQPLLSKLYFIPSEKEDGMLHTYEIYNLNIPAQLVILSACNTASGKLERGEGIISLERAFQFAGSKSLLATLWTVDDESSFKITQLFLKNLKDGKAKDIALQEAKLNFLNSSSPDKLHPFYWSSFRLTGNTSPLKITSSLKYYIIGCSIALFFIAIYFRRKQLKKAA